MNGYYCWKASASNGGTDRKGMLQVIRIEGQDPDIRVFEDPSPASLLISIPALQRIQGTIPVQKVSSDTYLVGIHQVHAVEPVRPIKADTGEITI